MLEISRLSPEAMVLWDRDVAHKIDPEHFNYWMHTESMLNRFGRTNGELVEMRVYVCGKASGFADACFKFRIGSDSWVMESC